MKSILLTTLLLLMSGCGATTLSGHKQPCNALQAMNWPISRYELNAPHTLDTFDISIMKTNYPSQDLQSLRDTIHKAFRAGDQLWSFVHHEGVNEIQGYVLLRDCDIVLLVETQHMLVND